jgi:hypothetical protein
MFTPQEEVEYARIVARSWSDSAFREEMIANPKEVLSRHRIAVPDHVVIHVNPDSDKTMVELGLPSRPLLGDEQIAISTHTESSNTGGPFRAENKTGGDAGKTGGDAAKTGGDTSGKTGYDTPAPGKTGDDTPAPGKTGYDTPAPGKTGYDTPAPGKTGYDTPAPGKTGYDTPAPGKTGYDTPAPGKTGGDTPAPGKTGGDTPAPGKTGGDAPAKQGGGQ